MNDESWFKKAIIYQILIDRFAGFKTTKNWDKPDFLGGNIKGIISKIPYLKKLGVNTIWISPFYKTSEYHGYHITDFYNVDPHFGKNDDLKRLVEKVHNQNMYIIADFVPNHCSNQHPYFIDAQNSKNSEYKKWFYFKKWPDDYLCFLSIKQLPKFNLNYPDTCNYIINAAKHWLSLGFDGFRLDHVIGPSHQFWKKFRTEIKKLFPNAVLIGEAWMKGIKFNELKTINVKNKILKWMSKSTSDSLLKEYVSELDGVLDFRFQELVRDFFASGKISEKDFLDLLKKHYKQYPENYFLPTFLDNHDMDRFLFECNNSKEKLKQAAKFQFSINQPKIIYYGTETGLSQKISLWNFTSHGDLQARKPMNWKSIDKDLLKFYKHLIKSVE